MNTSVDTEYEQLPRSFHLPRAARWLLLVASLACIVASYVHTFRAPQNRLSDFAGYYTAAKLVATGDSVASMYDDQWFIGRLGQFGILDRKMVFYVNPPPVSLLMTPLAGLDPEIAKGLWIGINLGIVLLVIYLLNTHLRIPSRTGLNEVILALVVCSVPFLRNIQRGQIYLLMLLLIVLMWKGYDSRRPWLTGVSLAFLLLFKYFGWMFILLLLTEKRWKELGWTGVTFITCTGICIRLLGVDMYIRHVERLLTSLRAFDVASTGLPSLPALFGGLFVAHPSWNTMPVADSPLLASALIFVSLILLLALTLRTHRRIAAEHRPFGFLSILVLSVLFTPLAADHHYILLALPLFFAVMWMERISFVSGYFLLLGVTMYLLLGLLPNLPIDHFSGWFKLFAFGRVYGALLLWFLLISTCTRMVNRTSGEHRGPIVGNA